MSGEAWHVVTSGLVEPPNFDEPHDPDCPGCQIERLTTALKDAERERERLRRALERIAAGDLPTRCISAPETVPVDGKPREVVYVERLTVKELAREALQEPAPQGAETCDLCWEPLARCVCKRRLERLRASQGAEAGE